MSRLRTSPCPGCSNVGTLSIVAKLVARPLGSFSLAGTQTKVPAQERPVLCCSECTYQVVGRFDIDGKRAVFDVGST